ncbi:MAG: serine/threonine-protein phosphatase [Desulfosarcina sp.]|nr:serine/threonine-protein phosphatase [Desulfobacterales bacterium]
MLMIDSAGLSDVGRKRKINQDCFSIEDNLHLYVVADGMGGHRAGEVAGRMAVDAIRNYFVALDNNTKHPPRDRHDDSLSSEANHLLNAVDYANSQVYQASVDKPDFRGMGSTVAALLFTPNTFIAANVGDSSIYLIHENNIERISVPHTVIAAQNELEPDQRTVYSPDFQHMLTRGIGIEAAVDPDFCESQCFDGDRFIICSDGLSDKVSPAEILNLASSAPPQRICRVLIDLANERGGDDNITVVVLTIKMLQGLWPRLKQKLFSFLN